MVGDGNEHKDCVVGILIWSEPMAWVNVGTAGDSDTEDIEQREFKSSDLKWNLDLKSGCYKLLGENT